MMLDTLLAALFAATWKGSVLIVIAAAIHGLFGDRIPAKWRHAILALAMLRLLVPFGPAAPFSVFNLAASRGATIVGNTEPSVVPVAIRQPAARPAMEFPERKPADWKLVASAIWTTGAAAFLSWIAFGSIRISRRLRHARQLESGDPLVELLDACRAQAGMRRRVRLLVTDAVDNPSLHGVIRPSLLLPRDVLQAFTREELRFVFLHELAHLRRSDVVLNWITAFVHALHWFNPLVWIAVARLDEERELACDALALELIGRSERTAYGETVLRMLDHLRAPAMVPGVVGMTTTKQQVKRRMLMIATFRNDSRRTALFAALVVVLAVVTLTDARAGEGEKILVRKHKTLSPQAEATFQQLNVPLTVAFTNATPQAILDTVSNRTGVPVRLADGVVLPQALVTLKATDVPAQVVLIETLASLDLGVSMEDGVTVIKETPRRHVMVHRGDPGAVGNEVVVATEGDDATATERVIVVGSPEGRAHAEAVVSGARKMTVKVETNASEDGVTRRKTKYHGRKDGVETEGTLEIEVKKQ